MICRPRRRSHQTKSGHRQVHADATCRAPSSPPCCSLCLDTRSGPRRRSQPTCASPGGNTEPDPKATRYSVVKGSELKARNDLRKEILSLSPKWPTKDMHAINEHRHITTTSSTTWFHLPLDLYEHLSPPRASATWLIARKGALASLTEWKGPLDLPCHPNSVPSI